MPHSVFFHGGFAVHGTYAVGSLGRAVSHGCVRLAPGNAATLYSLVRANLGNSRIVIGY
jgi:lipoprotein-anchoring transpeptidase ErfK/SrfK